MHDAGLEPSMHRQLLNEIWGKDQGCSIKDHKEPFKTAAVVSKQFCFNATG
jgi:hypothetical protein